MSKDHKVTLKKKQDILMKVGYNLSKATFWNSWNIVWIVIFAWKWPCRNPSATEFKVFWSMASIY